MASDAIETSNKTQASLLGLVDWRLTCEGTVSVVERHRTQPQETGFSIHILGHVLAKIPKVLAKS